MTAYTGGPVLVIGAGIAGLALARSLAGHGIACVVVERRPEPPEAGLGINLPGNAVRALRTLGVDGVVAHGVPVARREYRSNRDRLLFAMDENAMWDGVAASVCVRRRHLLHALQPQAALATIRYGVPISGVTPVDDQVRVEFGGTGDTESYDLVIGADGVNSPTRAAVTSATVRPSAMTAAGWRFVTANPGVDCWTAWTGSAGTFLLIPVEPGLVYGYATCTAGAGVHPGRMGDTFGSFPAAVAQTVDQVLADPAQLHHSPVTEVRCERWSNGRLILVGDAAHATGPVWAQGAALALEDALVLAELLAARSDWSQVGAEYEARRRPRVDAVVAATDKMSRLARTPGLIRNLVAPLLGPRTYRETYEPLRPEP